MMKGALIMDFEKQFIDGRWVKSSAKHFIEVENPATGEFFARVPAGTAEDVNQAAHAACRAFPGWAATPLSERIALMKKLLGV